MTDAPDQIWAFHAPDIEQDNPGCTIVAGEKAMPFSTKYIREDRYNAAILDRQNAESELDAAFNEGVEAAAVRIEEVYCLTPFETIKRIAPPSDNFFVMPGPFDFIRELKR